MKIRTPLTAALLLLLSAAAFATATEIKGKAILDHPCGKTAVKHMGLVNAGKMAEAVKLGTKEMQEEWNAMPAEDREMLTGMMKEMSFPSDKFSADIQAGGLLSVDGENATLTVKQEHKEAGGTSTSTMTQKYKVSGASCAISK
jgi:Skp family chaperone for outer membrane proteins